MSSNVKADGEDCSDKLLRLAILKKGGVWVRFADVRKYLQTFIHAAAPSRTQTAVWLLRRGIQEPWREIIHRLAARGMQSAKAESSLSSSNLSTLSGHLPLLRN